MLILVITKCDASNGIADIIQKKLVLYQTVDVDIVLLRTNTIPLSTTIPAMSSAAKVERLVKERRTFAKRQPLNDLVKLLVVCFITFSLYLL